MLRSGHIGKTMPSERRFKGWRRRMTRRGFAGVILAFVLGALSACSVVAGGGVAVALIGISALTTQCYDYLDVTVLDSNGRKTCAATVTASRAKSSEHFELESCFYTPLSDGHWTLRATLAGNADAVSELDVEHKDDCTRHTQSVELTLGASSVQRVPRFTSVPATPAVSSAPASSVFPPQVNAAPSASSATPLSGAAGAENSGAAGAPPIGVFPNQPEPSP